MTFKGSIKKGDVPETDAEVDQAIAQMQKQEANKQARLNAARGRNSAKHDRQQRLAIVRTNETGRVVDVAANHEPGQALPEDMAERAASGSGYQGEEVVTSAKPTSAPKTRRQARPKVEKKPKTPKVKAPATPKQFNYEGLNPHGYAKVTPDVVIRAFELKFGGMKSPEIAKTLNISMSSVSTIFAAPVWFREAQQKKATRLGISFTYPEKVEKAPEKKVTPLAKVEKPATKKSTPKGK